KRIEAFVIAHGTGYLGSHRGCLDQAVRFSTVLPWPGPRRTLYPRRSVLSVVESEGVGFPDTLHRTGRRDQQCHALSRGLIRQQGSESTTESSERCQSTGARGGLQERHR